MVVDYFSRFLEVAILKSTTSAKIIEALSPIFARFDVPFSLRTDNGPPFVSEEFETFLCTHGVEHRRSTKLWPQVNGEVERQNRSLLRCLQTAHLEKKNWRSELVSWLSTYRSTPQVTTGAILFSLMFGREMRSKLPELRRESVNVSREEARDKDWSKKLKGQEYADDKRGAVLQLRLLFFWLIASFGLFSICSCCTVLNLDCFFFCSRRKGRNVVSKPGNCSN